MYDVRFWSTAWIALGVPGAVFTIGSFLVGRLSDWVYEAGWLPRWIIVGVCYLGVALIGLALVCFVIFGIVAATDLLQSIK